MKIISIFTLLIFLALLFPEVTSAATPVHPFLLFHDISQTPGYQYRTLEPWRGWERDIITSADESLSRNFSDNLGEYDGVSYRGELARDLGMAYQISGQTEYALKAREALLNLETGTVGVDPGDSNAIVRAKSDKARALAGYSLAYDWVQPALDPGTDLLIRDELAMLADTVYNDLNDNGSNREYVSFADHVGQAYPTMGVASAVLNDYTNPNNLPISSTHEEWHRVATEYLFENDKLHSYNRSLFSFGFDEASGKYLSGAYKCYVTDDFALWFQVSNYFYGENLLETYPAAKRGFTSELWESLPDGYSDNYVTNGNTKWTYHTAFLSLFTDIEKSELLNHLDRIEQSGILPYSSVMSGTFQGGVPSALLYSVYGNYSALPRTFPANTSHLDPNAITQLIRGNWSDDADWLSLVTFNPPVTRTNRDMGHHDQLSFEYYSRGDLLLADAGEPKHILEDEAGEGKFAIFHNTISIENPRSPFTASAHSGSSSLGIYKGENTDLVTPSTVDTILQAPWIQAVQAHVTITKLCNETGIYSTLNLTSPIRYTRTVLYPESDYFIIVDRLEGTEEWTYRTLFRPTSLMVTPTVDTNKDDEYNLATELGQVNGDLTLGATPYNWQSLPYKTETGTGLTTNAISWATTNPYGKEVRLDIVSAPSSEILVTKHVGRIGGYQPTSEVYNPVVYLKSPPANNLYRVTALLSRYSGEPAKSAEEIPVQGSGNALRVHSTNYDDYLYTGTGNSSFAAYSTDADTCFIRENGQTLEFTLLNGSYLHYQNQPWVALSDKADFLSLMKTGNSLDYRISGNEEPHGSLFQHTTMDWWIKFIDWISEILGDMYQIVASFLKISGRVVEK